MTGSLDGGIMETLGYIGGLLLALCGAPQAFKSIKDKHSNGVSLLFLLMWLAGEILLLLYSFQFHSIPLYLNYGFNIVVVSVILWYKVFPHQKHKKQVQRSASLPKGLKFFGRPDPRTPVSEEFISALKQVGASKELIDIITSGGK